jgi:membrane protease YdiL (CAAX protease family)
VDTPAPAPAPVPAPALRKSAAAFFGVLVLLRLVGVLAQGASPVAGLVWDEVFALATPALVAAAGSNLLPSAYLRMSRARPHTIALGFLAGAAGYVFASALMAAVSTLLPGEWVESFDLSRLLAGPGWRKWAFAAAAALVAPVCEEMAFRGYLLTTIGLRRGPVAAIVVTSVLFAFFHLDPVRLAALLPLGALFGWLAWRAGSIWPAVAAHAANNATATLLFVLAGGGEEVTARPTAADLAFWMIVGLALLAPIVSAYRTATPEPPPFEEALAPRDPARGPAPFQLALVPPRYGALWLVGSASLAALLLAAALRAG